MVSLFKLLIPLLAVPLFGQITSYTQTFAIPPAGTPHAKGVPFTDPTFHTLLVRLTDQNTGGSGLSTYPDGCGGYSEWIAFNANNTFFSSACAINGANAYVMTAFNPSEFKLGGHPVGTSFSYRGTAGEARTWSPTNPNIFYAPQENSQVLQRWNIHGSANPVNWTHTNFDMSSQMGGGTTLTTPCHLTLDESLIECNVGGDSSIIVWNLNTNSLVRHITAPVAGFAIGRSQISYDGSVVFTRDVQAPSPCGAASPHCTHLIRMSDGVDLSASIDAPGSHYAMTNTNLIQVINDPSNVCESGSGADVAVLSLATGARTDRWCVAAFGDAFQHYSNICAVSGGTCTSNLIVGETDTSQPGVQLHAGEIDIADIQNGTFLNSGASPTSTQMKFYRVAHHHSIIGNGTFANIYYESHPHATWDGTMIVFDSFWEVSGGRYDRYAILLPKPSIASIEPTQQQAIVRVLSSDPSSCTIAASRGSSIGASIPDIVDNGNTASRVGTVVDAGYRVSFVLGTRKSNDSLAANATYTVQATCSDGTTALSTFTTLPIQWSNTAPDIVPFNAAKFGNMDHPAIDFNSTAAANTFCDPSTHSYCDPNTGVEYWPVSRPGWGTQAAIQTANGVGAWAGTPIDVSGTGKWANPSNISFHGASPSAYASATGSVADKLFVPLGALACPQGGTFAGFGGNCTIDDINFDVWCGNATTSSVTGFNIQLSIDGGQTVMGNQITTGNCAAAAPARLATYPAGDASPVARPIFKSWGYLPKRNMIVPPAGTVSVSGTAVTLTTANPGPGNYFNLDWAAGTPILINGAYAHLAAPPATSTTLTTVESLGTLTNVSYNGANFGVVLTKTNASSTNVDVSIGLNYAFSQLPDQGVNGDREMLNKASVSVTKSADGTSCGIYAVGCSNGTINPPVTGYIGVTQHGGWDAIFLWVPSNSDGSPRGETRLLSQSWKPAGSPRLVGNGDPMSSSVQLSGALMFDDSDGTSVYGADVSGKRAWRLTYNEAYAGCAGYVTYHPFSGQGDYNDSNHSVADDCFTWTVLTPLAGGKDIKTQIMGTDGHSGAYQTGLNYLGQTVCSVHTGFDLGWMPTIGVYAVNSGFLIASASTGVQNHLNVFAAFADDGTGKFVIKSIRNMWNEGALRWGGAHTCPATNMGTYEYCVMDALDDTTNSGLVFPNRNRATVSQVNRAGFGSPAAWDSNTALTSNTDFYTCPSSLPAPYTYLSGTTNCLQVRLSTPFCQVAPNATYIFPDGKTEKDEFPCVTPGFGVANASYSKLQDIQVGDWLYASDTGLNGERFTVLTAPVYNSATNITFWVGRTMGYLFNSPAYSSPSLDETNSVGHSTALQSCCTHSGSWYLWAAPTGGGVPGGGVSAVLDISNPNNTWLSDNPSRFAAHGTAGPGMTGSTYSYFQGGCGASFNFYCGTSNLSAAASVNVPLTNTATSTPSFAGQMNPGTGMQTYQNATYGAAATPLLFFVDFKAINPSSPAGAEANNSFGSMSLSLVGGTTKTYAVAADCCTGSPDYKRWGLQGLAGRFWFRDVSSPATFGSAADMPDWSVCWARNNNECVFGSTPGKLYMTPPKADLKTTCYSANFGLAVPCLSSFGPITGQTVQFRIDRPDAVGLSYRKFGFAHNHIGLGYPFSNCRTTPSAAFMFCPGYWLDGVRTEWLAFRIDALPPVDSVNRTTFVPISLTYQGVPFAYNIRARFGYAENGGDSLQCTAYGQDCSTEIPNGSPNDPFSFTNEAVTRQACANGANCTITIPSLPNRILYYVVDRLDASGGIIATSPLQAIAVP